MQRTSQAILIKYALSIRRRKESAEGNVASSFVLYHLNNRKRSTKGHRAVHAGLNLLSHKFHLHGNIFLGGHAHKNFE